MHPSSRWPHIPRDILQKRNHIVIGPQLNLSNLCNVELCFLPDRNCVPQWDHTNLRHRFTSESLDL